MVLSLPAEDGIDMLKTAYAEQREEKAYRLYLALRPNMTEKDYVTFENFYQPEKENEEPEEDKTAEEILQGVKEIMNSHSWR